MQKPEKLFQYVRNLWGQFFLRRSRVVWGWKKRWLMQKGFTLSDFAAQQSILYYLNGKKYFSSLNNNFWCPYHRCEWEHNIWTVAQEGSFSSKSDRCKNISRQMNMTGVLKLFPQQPCKAQNRILSAGTHCFILYNSASSVQCSSFSMAASHNGLPCRCTEWHL